ncbi:hypothetical protein [Streptomyces sp. Je 1-79]|nr:hypothetical protein [Streptomyces sp. Je 1-79]
MPDQPHSLSAQGKVQASRKGKDIYDTGRRGQHRRSGPMPGG